MKIKIFQTLWTLWLVLWNDQTIFMRLRLSIGLCLIGISITLNLMLPWSLKWVVDNFMFQTTVIPITLILASYGILWTASQLVVNLRQIVIYRVFERGIHHFCHQIIKTLLELPMTFYNRQATGEIMNAIERAQFAIPAIMAGTFFMVVPTLMEVFLSLVLIGRYYGLMLAIGLMLLIGLYAGFTLLVFNWVVTSQRAGNLQHQKISRYITDILMNIESVHYQSGESVVIEQSKQLLTMREDAVTSQLVRNDLLAVGQKAIAGFGFIGITLWTGYQVFNQNMTIGDFVLFNGYLLQFIAPLNMLGFVGRDIREGLTKIEPALDILHEPSLMAKESSLKELVYQPYDLQFLNIHFAYSQTMQSILENVSFTLKKGSTIAIIGPNGTGKSTISKLIYKLYNPTKGNILIGGHDLQQLKSSFIRNLVGIVPQEIFLLNASIKENLLFGARTFQELDKILEITGLKSWVETLPEGLDTQVGERGMRLSGGQKRRIGIARALLRDPKILILDEAETSLDKTAEIQIFTHIQQSYQNISKLVITHNERILEMADEVIYLNKGKVTLGNKTEIWEHYFQYKEKETIA